MFTTAIFMALLMKIILLCLAAGMFLGFQFCILRFFDIIIGLDFKEQVDNMEKDPKAIATYLGLRYLAISLSMSILVFAAFIL